MLTTGAAHFNDADIEGGFYFLLMILPVGQGQISGVEFIAQQAGIITILAANEQHGGFPDRIDDAGTGEGTGGFTGAVGVAQKDDAGQ